MPNTVRPREAPRVLKPTLDKAKVPQIPHSNVSPDNVDESGELTRFVALCVTGLAVCAILADLLSGTESAAYVCSVSLIASDLTRSWCSRVAMYLKRASQKLMSAACQAILSSTTKPTLSN